MDHTRGKIKRYHRSMMTEERERNGQVYLDISEPAKGAAPAENIIRLDNCYLLGELETRIAEWVDDYNDHRYHEALGTITPADKYAGRDEQIFKRREDG